MRWPDDFTNKNDFPAGEPKKFPIIIMDPSLFRRRQPPAPPGIEPVPNPARTTMRRPGPTRSGSYHRPTFPDTMDAPFGLQVDSPSHLRSRAKKPGSRPSNLPNRANEPSSPSSHRPSGSTGANEPRIDHPARRNRRNEPNDSLGRIRGLERNCLQALSRATKPTKRTQRQFRQNMRTETALVAGISRPTQMTKRTQWQSGQNMRASLALVAAISRTMKMTKRTQWYFGLYESTKTNGWFMPFLMIPPAPSMLLSAPIFLSTLMLKN